MREIKVNVKINDRSGQVLQRLQQHTERNLQRLAERMVARAKLPPPMGSPVAGVRVPEWSWVKHTEGPGGHNRDSIALEQDGPLKFRVHTQSGYGGFLELGTSKMPARPYFAPAFKEADQLFRKDMKNVG